MTDIKKHRGFVMKTIKKELLVIFLLSLAAILHSTTSLASINQKQSNSAEEERISHFYQVKSSWFQGLYALSNKNREVRKVINFLTNNTGDAMINKQGEIFLMQPPTKNFIPLVILETKTTGGGGDDDEDGDKEDIMPKNSLQRIKDDPAIINIVSSTETETKNFLFIKDNLSISKTIKGILLFYAGYKLMTLNNNPEITIYQASQKSYEQVHNLLLSLGGQEYAKEVLSESKILENKKQLLPSIKYNKKVCKLFLCQSEEDKKLIHEFFYLQAIFETMKRYFPNSFEEKEIQFLKRSDR